MALALTSTASMRNRSAGTPASSSAIAIEYGSSPVEDGRLNRRNTPSAGARNQLSWPMLASVANASRSRKNQVSGTTDDRFDQRLQLGPGRAHTVPINVPVSQAARREPFLHGALDGRRANRA